MHPQHIRRIAIASGVLLSTAGWVTVPLSADTTNAAVESESTAAFQIEIQQIYARALHRFVQMKDVDGHAANPRIQIMVLDHLIADLDSLRNMLVGQSTANQSEKIDDVSARRLAMLQTHRATPLDSDANTPQLAIVNVNRSQIVTGVEDALSSARRARNFANAAKERDVDLEIRRAERALLALAKNTTPSR